MLLGMCALNASTASARVERGGTHLIAYVQPGSTVALRANPSGRVVGRVGSITPFGSDRALGVVTSLGGRWLGVTVAGFGHNRLVWVDAQDAGLHFGRTEVALEADLSSRTLLVRRSGVTVRRFRVGVGRPGSTTPTGSFTITDKLGGRAYGAFYGCCIIALSATQHHLPPGWRGGTRVAIHGTPSSSDFGRAVSAGCLHASDSALRFLMRVAPLGATVTIRP
jgi:L,D-transpeptidase catalytic domain